MGKIGKQSYDPKRSTEEANRRYVCQGSDLQRSAEQANCKYGCQGSDLQRSAEQTMNLLQLSDQVVQNCQTGEQMMHWDMLNKENSNMVALFKMFQ